MNDREIPVDLLEKIRPKTCDNLYKYRSVNKCLKRIIFDQEIYFASPTEFNDPFDCYPRITYYRDHSKQHKFFLNELIREQPDKAVPELDKIARLMIDSSYWADESIRDNFHKTVQNYGIFSMAQKNDNLLMWSHYADSHKGVCLEFDSRDTSNVFGEAIMVQYQKEYPKVNVMALGNFRDTINAFGVKSADWKYEKEWRIIRAQVFGGRGIYKFEPDQLVGVILGAKICPRQEEKVLSWVAKYPRQLKVYRAKINSRKYKVDIVANET